MTKTLVKFIIMGLISAAMVSLLIWSSIAFRKTNHEHNQKVRANRIEWNETLIEVNGTYSSCSSYFGPLMNIIRSDDYRQWLTEGDSYTMYLIKEKREAIDKCFPILYEFHQNKYKSVGDAYVGVFIGAPLVVVFTGLVLFLFVDC
jgi:hypothetical protein